MQRINKKDINSQNYWDNNIAEPKFGLRQKKYLELAGKGDSIVELGCGMSPFLNKARKNFKRVVGLDFSTRTIIEARNKFPKVDYIYGDSTKSPFKDKEFDVSVAGEMIEHLENPRELVDEMKRITKKRIIISSAHMEYNDPEHLWIIEPEDFPEAKAEWIESEWFPGRKYLFLTIDL